MSKAGKRLIQAAKEAAAIARGAEKMREFARVDDVKPGDTLIADDGFDCIQEGTHLIVQKDSEGTLYVPCKGGEGRHYLQGQIGGPFGGLEPETHYVGFYKAES